MKSLIFNRKLAQLALLQRIELASPGLKKLRKVFGRYLFSKLFSKYFINVNKISEDYSELMQNEFRNIAKLIKGKIFFFKYWCWYRWIRITDSQKFCTSAFYLYRKKLCFK